MMPNGRGGAPLDSRRTKPALSHLPPSSGLLARVRSAAQLRSLTRAGSRSPAARADAPIPGCPSSLAKKGCWGTFAWARPGVVLRLSGRRSWAWCTILLTLVAAPACISLKRTPEARFFVLTSVSAPASMGSEIIPSGVVGLLTVRLPGHLERPQLVSRLSSGELEVHEFFRWAEPLDRGVQRVVGENLSALMPEHRVVRQPWPSATDLTCRISLEISVCGVWKSGQGELTGRYVLLPARGEVPLVAQAFRFERPAPSSGRSAVTPEGTVAILSDLLGDLSVRLAEAVRRLPQRVEAP